MYGFITKLFNEEDYEQLLGGEEDAVRTKDKLLIVPYTGESFTIERKKMSDERSSHSILGGYPVEYFNMVKFVNPTHNNSNCIGGNRAFISHCPTHMKMTNTFFKMGPNNEPLKNAEGKNIIQFKEEKIQAFVDAIAETEYSTRFPQLISHILDFIRRFDSFNRDNRLGLEPNDFIVFLVEESQVDSYVKTVKEYVSEKILKYPSYRGLCDNCGNEDELFMIPTGNTFDLAKGRKYLLRNPTRYLTDTKEKSPQNYNVCRQCAVLIYNFFEYIKRYRFYRYVFPTTVKVRTSDYNGYHNDPKGILKMLKAIYEKNPFNEFDYIMMLTNPMIDEIEFRYISSFSFDLPKGYPEIHINDLPIYSGLKELRSKAREDEVLMITNDRTKLVFLMEMNLLFNNTLIGALFETNMKNLMKNLHPFLRLKIIEYNSIIRNYIFFQDSSLFQDRIYSRLVRDILTEIMENAKYRDDLKIDVNKIRLYLTIYYKYLNLEREGGDSITEYMKLKERLPEIAKGLVEEIKLENEFEASYFMGQLYYYLLRISKVKNQMDLFTKYTMNVSNMEMMKKKLLTVLDKYSHNEYIDNNRTFHRVMKSVLAYEFKRSFEDNKIAIYTGYFDNNCLYLVKDQADTADEEDKGMKE